MQKHVEKGEGLSSAARDKLRAAIATRREAEKAAAESAAAVDKAREIVGTAEREAAKFAGIDAESGQFIAERIAAVALGGGNKPALSCRPNCVGGRKQR